MLLTSTGRLRLGTFIISLGVLVFEITLARVFSAVLHLNVVFIAITIALFGIAIGGIIVYARERTFTGPRMQDYVGFFALAFALSIIAFTVFLVYFPFRSLHVLSVPLLIFVSAIPFLLANVCLSIIFTAKSTDIARLYFFDLMGAGIGVGIAILFLEFFSAVNVMLLTGTMLLLSTYFFLYHRPVLRRSLGAAAVVILGLTFLNSAGGSFGLPYGKIDSNQAFSYDKWNSFSRITVTDGPGTWESYGDMPESLAEYLIDVRSKVARRTIQIDAGAATEVTGFNGDFASVAYLQKDLSAAAYAVRNSGSSLIIGPGGGRDVLMALGSGYTVRGAEINPIIVNDLMRDELREFSGDLYFRPDVEILVEEGRSFLERDTDRYDVLHLPLVDTWASTAAGNLALTESHLYTVEAFTSYLEHLNDDGLLSITRWEFDGMRLISLYLAAAEQRGIQEPERSIAIMSVRPGEITQMNNYLFKQSPFTDTELEKLKSFAQESGFSFSYLPDEDSATAYDGFITETDRDAFLAAATTDLSPVYDNNPFFFFQTKPADIASFGKPKSAYDSVIGELLFVVGIMTLMILLLPMYLFPKDHVTVKKSIATFDVGYFGVLGLAFLLLEVVLIQQFILYLEKPIFSFSVVLAAILFFAGIGSFLSHKVNALRIRNYLYVTLGIFFLVLLERLLIPPLLQNTIGYPLTLKIVITIAIHAPLALLMGMLLPLGALRLALLKREMLIPWGWALNGALSVVASILAVMLSVIFGFQTVMLIAAAIYLLAPALLFFSFRSAK